MSNSLRLRVQSAQVGVSSAILLAFSSAPAYSDPLQLEFESLTSAGMVEQDVFVTTDDGARVRRVPLSQIDEMRGSELYGTTEPPAFEPLKLNPTETYAKGRALGLTLDEWLAASGSGSYECVEGKSSVSLQFDGLVPNAVYTVWNFIDAEPPTDPWQTLLFPLGARDGSDAEFETDSEGRAAYKATFQPCLETSGTQTLAGLAVAWHADGKVYGALPGDLGVVTFTQIMALLPP